MHDVGKIGVPDAILLKPAELTEDEWEFMRRHPAMGYRILAQVPYLRPAAKIVLAHHERWDGDGYPRRLKAKTSRWARASLPSATPTTRSSRTGPTVLASHRRRASRDPAVRRHAVRPYGCRGVRGRVPAVAGRGARRAGEAALPPGMRSAGRRAAARQLIPGRSARDMTKAGLNAARLLLVCVPFGRSACAPDLPGRF